MKKLVALVLAVAVITSITSVCVTAVADSCGNHTYEWQYGGGATIWDWKDSQNHQLKYLYVQVCTKCGVTGASSYIVPKTGSEIKPHVDSGARRNEHIAGTTTHAFYKVCSDCHGLFSRRVVDCPGGNAHVSFTFP